MMKILFTSVGRRVELIQGFHQAAEKLNIDLEIWGADFSTEAPALYFCDKRVQCCGIREAGYIPFLLELCEKEKIQVLIPTIDTDLLILAENKGNFEAVGTKVLVSAPDKVALCRDKRKTGAFFEQCGLCAPIAVDDYKLYSGNYPAFIKPLDGSSSIDAYKVKNLEELEYYSEKIKNYIVQPFVQGKEYTIDIFCDYEGNPIYITPRERIAVRSGEVLQTRIEQNEEMIREMQQLVAMYRPCGQITVQLIRDMVEKKNYYIEINPRFGGGAPLSMKAGADSAMALLQILKGKKLEYVPYAARDGEMYSRFDQSVCIKEGR